MRKEWIGVAETKSYAADARKIFTEDEREQVKELIAKDPEIGDVVSGTGGVRKVRVALQGGGKSGGARVIYYYHDETVPLILIALFAKNEKDNLSKAERNDLKKDVSAIKERIRTRRGK